MVKVSKDGCSSANEEYVTESTNSGIFTIADDNQHKSACSNMVIFNTDSIEREMDNASFGTCGITPDQFLDDGSDIYILNADICASTSKKYDVSPVTNATTCKHFVVDSSSIDIFNSDICASTCEEYENDYTNKEVTRVVTPGLFTIHTNGENINDTYNVRHENNVINSSNVDIFNLEISQPEEQPIESSNMEDDSSDFRNTTRQILLDGTNMEIVSSGVCTIIPKQMATIDLNSKLEILNPDDCNPLDDFALVGISDMENIVTNLRTLEEDSAMRCTQVYLIDYPDYQEELLKAFSIPSSSNAELKIVTLEEPQANRVTHLEYDQNTEKQDKLHYADHPVSEPSANVSESTIEIERETLLQYSDDIVNDRVEQLPNLAISNVAVEPDVSAINDEEDGDTLLKYYQNIEDQLQFSDFSDPNSSIDGSEFLGLSGREDSATLNTEIPKDLADIRMESLIGSKVDKSPGNEFLLIVIFFKLYFNHYIR